MSLLDDFGRQCTVLVRTKSVDGEGGSNTVWSDGAVITCYMSRDTSTEARRAEREGVTSVYSVLVSKGASIEYGDLFREDESGTVFRVTSKPDEKAAPTSAGAVIRGLKFFTAERSEMPND